MRKTSYGENRKLSLVDRAGAFLSSRKLTNIAMQKRPDVVVDLGCGYDALLLQKLKPYCRQAIGIDLRVNSRVEGVRLIECAISDNLSMIESDFADLFIMNNVLEHLAHPQKIMGEAHRILKNGGMLFANAPTWWGKRMLEFSAFRMGWSDVEEMNDHKMYYDVKTMWPMLIKAGFLPRDVKIGTAKFFMCVRVLAVKTVTGKPDEIH